MNEDTYAIFKGAGGWQIDNTTRVLPPATSLRLYIKHFNKDMHIVPGDGA
ncbi:MAG: hypothetical protein ACLTJG_17560 [[Clostridium] innocuum]